MRFLQVFIKKHLPKALFPRSLLIIILPVALAQIIASFVFLERHWNSVTRKLTHSAIGNVAMLVELRMSDLGGDGEALARLANDSFGMSLAFLPGETLPPSLPSPFVELLDTTLINEINQQINRPSWINTSYNKFVDVRLQLPGEVMRALIQKDKVYATNSYIFIVWMVGATFILLAISIMFLRNQIRPIEKLATAAEQFGRGQELPNFRPSGASEIYRASLAFLQMRDRIKAFINQRTTMLAGVSHDLRTPLTRLKLQLALFKRSNEVSELESDIIEMENMLDDYLDFAKGYQSEQAREQNITSMLEDILNSASLRQPNKHIKMDVPPLLAKVKRFAFKRCITNLVNNACNYADYIHIGARIDGTYLVIQIDDDGPGIPHEKREDVFRPFYRLDDARSTSTGGTGLGLAIARDIARNHGGNIWLSQSSLGGLCAQTQIPI